MLYLLSILYADTASGYRCVVYTHIMKKTSRPGTTPVWLRHIEPTIKRYTPLIIAVLFIIFLAWYYHEDQSSGGTLSFSHLILVLFYSPLIILIASLAYLHSRRKNQASKQANTQASQKSTPNEIIGRVALLILIFATLLYLSA